MTRRLLISTALSATMTALLLFLMLSLIDSGKDGGMAARTLGSMDLIRVVPDETVVPRRSTPPRPPTPQPPPDLVQPQPASPAAVAVTFDVGMVPVPPPDAGPLAVMENSPLMAVVKPEPMYPRRAIERGLSGTVTVQYTVGASGTVTDVRILESSDRVFNSAALTAAANFRYKPRMIDGAAVATEGVRNRFNFVLDEE